ncbi:MAG: cytidylyltransferase domain-containing protein [Patescibacteria group bacterium]
MKILAITQARVESTRLPGKVLKTIGDKTLLEIHLSRILQSKLISKLKVATTTETNVNKIIAIVDKLGIESFQGAIENVLERFYLTALSESPDYVVRLTSDCPLIDPTEIDKVIEECINGDYDYVSNVLEPTLPDGMDVEIFKFSVLEQAHQEASLRSDREHVTPYIWRNSTVKGGNIFKSLSVKYLEDFSNFRLTVDTPDDFDLIEKLIIKLGDDKRWQDYVSYLEKNSDLISINSKYERNEGLKKSIAQE